MWSQLMTNSSRYPSPIARWGWATSDSRGCEWGASRPARPEGLQASPCTVPRDPSAGWSSRFPADTRWSASHVALDQPQLAKLTTV